MQVNCRLWLRGLWQLLALKERGSRRQTKETLQQSEELVKGMAWILQILRNGPAQLEARAEINSFTLKCWKRAGWNRDQP